MEDNNRSFELTTEHTMPLPREKAEVALLNTRNILVKKAMTNDEFELSFDDYSMALKIEVYEQKDVTTVRNLVQKALAQCVVSVYEQYFDDSHFRIVRLDKSA